MASCALVIVVVCGETNTNMFSYLLIYFGSLIAGNLFSLVLHKKDGDYSSVGASGAVSGIIFASIALFPGFNIGLLFFTCSFSRLDIRAGIHTLLHIRHPVPQQ